nr:sigma 54-interacting transcriptional regulator [Bacilli bacterium]
MLRKERVFAKLEMMAMSAKRSTSGIPLGVSAGELAQSLSILRNNCSADLKSLEREGRVICISGRPTRYLPKQWLEKQIGGAPLLVTSFVDELAFLDAMKQHRIKESIVDHDEIFERAMGSQQSLQEATNLAKMALRYPPHGMHVLLVGQTGVGKSTFAKAMYHFALENEYISSSAIFCAFNCAEYANNPEILLDHLFGHNKGAFTGALRDKEGLVEVADGGVLFLDEVHRLPPEGQEMLFHLLDYGEFRRLGEADATRKSRIRLFAATTESPESALLSTFLRRIPMVIRLPSLHEWSIHDRHALIYRLLFEEAKTIGKRFLLEASVLDVLLRTTFAANIGGLKNTITLSCANAYNHAHDENEIRITVNHLLLGSGDITYRDDSLRRSLQDVYVDTSIALTQEGWRLHDPTVIQTLVHVLHSLSELGFGHNEILDAMMRETQRHLVEPWQDQSLADIKQYVGNNFYEKLENVRDAVIEKAEARWANDLMAAIGRFLYAQTHRVIVNQDQGIEHFIEFIRQSLPDSYALAHRFFMLFDPRADLQQEEETIAVLALLLNGKKESTDLGVEIVVMLLGDKIASTIVQTAVHLVGETALITSMDIPLMFDDQDIQKQCEAYWQKNESKRGILFFTDLPAVRQWFAQTADRNPTRSMRLVFRPDLIAVTRALLIAKDPSVTVDQMATWLSQSLVNRQEFSDTKGKKVIYACSLTGMGTASAIVRILEDALPPSIQESIDVIAVEIGGGKELPSLTQRVPVAIVGSVNPHLFGVPYFAVEEILEQEGIRRLLQLIGLNEPILLQTKDTEVRINSDNPLRDHVRIRLERDLVFLNPLLVMRAIDEMVEALRPDLTTLLTPEWEARFRLHMAYAMERGVKKETLVYPYLERIRRLFPDEWKKLEKISSIIESYLGATPDDNELGYLFEMVFPDRAMEMFQ